MDEKLSLEEQLRILKKEQRETESAYSENLGKINQSILVAWAEEILQREEEINELKGKIAEQMQKTQTSDEKLEPTEEKRLVVISRKSPWQWIMRKINEIKKNFQEDVFGLKNIPGLSTKQLQDLREKRLNKYRKAVEAYHQEKSTMQEEKAWHLTKEEEQAFREGEKNVLRESLKQEKEETRPIKDEKSH